MAAKKVDSIEKLSNVYFLYGDEELLMEGALKRLGDMLSSQVDADFNMEVLNATEVGVEYIIDVAETVPLLSSRRLVIVREVDRLSRKDQQRLAGYLEAPNPETTLVLVAHFPKAGEQRDSSAMKRLEGSALFKRARQAGEVLKFSFAGRGRQQKIENWASEEFKKRGKRIEPGAGDLLLEKVGRELRDLGDAIERTCLFAADKEVIRRADIEQVVIPAAEPGIFELIDAVAERRRDLSLYLLNKLIQQGESPHRIFSLLLRQFRMIAKVKSLAADHDYRQIASRVGIPPFLVSKCMQQSKRFSSERLRSVFMEFKRAQVELHSSKYLGEREYQGSVLEMLIVRIIG